MKNKKTVISIATGILLHLCCATAQDTKPSDSVYKPKPPAWSVLATAYVSRQDNLVRLYTESNKRTLRLYANTILSLINRDYKGLQKNGEACVTAAGHTNEDYTEAFGCLLAVSRGAGVFATTKQRAFWLSRTKQYYIAHESQIDRNTGSNDPAGLKDVQIPRASEVLTWPNEQIVVDAGWREIKLHDASVLAEVDKITLPFLIDTGATGVNISKSDVVKFKLESKLIPLSYTTKAEDETGGTSIEMYYVRDLHFGPVRITNAYVSVSSGKTVIGIKPLSSLGRFSITANGITKMVASRTGDGVCAPMHFSRMPIASAVSYPFFVVPGMGRGLGLMLDSGMRTFGTVRNAIVAISRVRASILLRANELHDVTTYRVKLVQNGKVASYPSVEFVITISGIPVHGVVAVSDTLFVDPELDGAMNYNAIKLGSVSYDFTDNIMCMETSRNTGRAQF